jgi:type II secretory pathway pseudopilin PulG
MVKAAQKLKKGFTLVELLVVLAITMVTMVSLGAGAVYLQSAVTLDNGIRQVKTEIQSTQNLARNSFFSNSSSSTILTQKRISVGWLLTLTNNPSQKTITVTKRSLYVLFPNSNSVQYNFSSLRDDVIRLHQGLKGKDFSCNASNQLKLGSAGSTVNFSTGTTVTPVLCTEDSPTTRNPGNGAAEFITSSIKKANLSDQTLLPGTAPRTCYTGVIQANLFFTSGYGEPALTQNADCQLRIESKTGPSSSYRAIKVNAQTGSATTCGNLCP